jgi:hypothetical protein
MTDTQILAELRTIDDRRVELLRQLQADREARRAEQGATLKPEHLVYSATSRCPCGAGLAYIRDCSPNERHWDCSAVLTGTAIPKEQPGSRVHTDRLPFAFYEVKSEG